jgi:hypothetical protein
MRDLTSIQIETKVALGVIIILCAMVAYYSFVAYKKVLKIQSVDYNYLINTQTIRDK